MSQVALTRARSIVRRESCCLDFLTLCSSDVHCRSSSTVRYYYRTSCLRNVGSPRLAVAENRLGTIICTSESETGTRRRPIGMRKSKRMRVQRPTQHMGPTHVSYEQ